GGSFRLELETPLQFDHADAEDARILNPLAPVGTTTLSRVAVAGDSVLLVASSAGFGTPNHLVRIVEGTRGEIRRVRQVHTFSLATPVSRVVAAGALIQHVTTADSAAALIDGGKVRTLADQTVAGTMAFEVDDRQGLQPGNVIRVGAASDPNV